ncbi:unnamed protein product [Gordionus sp. m RMFG-2023]
MPYITLGVKPSFFINPLCDSYDSAIKNESIETYNKSFDSVCSSKIYEKLIRSIESTRIFFKVTPEYVPIKSNTTICLDFDKLSQMYSMELFNPKYIFLYQDFYQLIMDVIFDLLSVSLCQDFGCLSDDVVNNNSKYLK